VTQTKIIIGLIFAIVVSVLMSVGTDHYLSLRAAKQSNEDKALVIGATDAGIQVGVDNDREREYVDYAIGEARRQFQASLQEGRKNDQATADRADRVVPGSVRDAFKARRLARERSGDPGSEREARDTPGPATER
jgi:hypothetical protein